MTGASKLSGLANLPAASAIAGAMVVAAGYALSAPAIISDQNEIRESIVRIETTYENGYGSGTGFIVNDQRTIATNNHVIAGAQTINVAFLAGGKPTVVPARVVATDPNRDVAILETAVDLFGEPVTLAAYDIKPPTRVTAIGYPGAANFITQTGASDIVLEPTVTLGTVSRFLPKVPYMGDAALIQHTAAINPGNSGGPLFDDCGHVVGINTLRSPPEQFASPQGIFFAVSSAELRDILDTNDLPALIEEKPCSPEEAGKVRTITSKDEEVQAFDRLAACVRSRPCDHETCITRYNKKVSTELAAERKSEIDIRKTKAVTRCEAQGDSETFQTLLQCAAQTPCDYDKTCKPAVEKKLASEKLDRRKPLLDRVSAKATQDCQAIKAPGIWRGREAERGVWVSTVANVGGTTLVVGCDVSGPKPGSGYMGLAGPKGKREQWVGVRDVTVMIEDYPEPISMVLETRGEQLIAAMEHVETKETRGQLKEMAGKMSVGTVINFRSERLGLDETFSLLGAKDVLATCFKAKYVEQQAQPQQQQQGQPGQQGLRQGLDGISR